MDRKEGPSQAGTSSTTIKAIIKNNSPPQEKKSFF